MWWYLWWRACWVICTETDDELCQASPVLDPHCRPVAHSLPPCISPRFNSEQFRTEVDKSRTPIPNPSLPADIYSALLNNHHGEQKSRRFGRAFGVCHSSRGVARGLGPAMRCRRRSVRSSRNHHCCCFFCARFGRLADHRRSPRCAGAVVVCCAVVLSRPVADQALELCRHSEAARDQRG